MEVYLRSRCNLTGGCVLLTGKSSKFLFFLIKRSQFNLSEGQKPPRKEYLFNWFSHSCCLSRGEQIAREQTWVPRPRFANGHFLLALYATEVIFLVNISQTMKRFLRPDFLRQNNE